MKNINKLLVVSALAASLATLSACNTFEGMGEDIQKGGEKLESAAEGRPDSVVASDKRITREINHKYAGDSDLAGADIRVYTYWGKVTLEGQVRTSNLQERAVDYAREVNGVKQVTSKLTITNAY